MIRQVIQMLIVMLVGTRTVKPVHDLRKKPTREELIKRIDCFVKKYYGFCIAIFLLTLLIIVLIVALFCGVSAVESGNYYYHLKAVI